LSLLLFLINAISTSIEELLNLEIQMKQENFTTWWEVSEKSSDATYENYYSQLPHQSSDSLTMYIFSEKSYPKSLGVFAVKG
jgi:hypothetical protein